MVSLSRVTWAAKFCLLLIILSVSSLQQLAAHSHTEHTASTASYIEAHGQQHSLAVRLAELIEAEEPLQPKDVARLAAAVK